MQITLIAEFLDFVILDLLRTKLCNTQKDGLCARVCVYKYGTQQGYTELAKCILHNCETKRFVQYFFCTGCETRGLHCL